MKKEFIVSIQGQEFVNYEGLLAEAHEQGLCRISTTLVQIPHADNGNVAIVMAEVETGKGTFCGIGDASAANVGRMIAPHIIRMAETRAKARAMRDAVNIGMTAVEELGDSHDTEPTRSSNVREFSDTREPAEQPTRASNYTPTGVHNPRPARQTAESDSPKAQQHTGGRPALDSQLKAIRDLSRQAGTPEDPQPGDYNFQLAGARIQELQSATRQGGQA